MSGSKPATTPQRSRGDGPTSRSRGKPRHRHCYRPTMIYKRSSASATSFPSFPPRPHGASPLAAKTRGRPQNDGRPALHGAMDRAGGPPAARGVRERLRRGSAALPSQGWREAPASLPRKTPLAASATAPLKTRPPRRGEGVLPSQTQHGGGAPHLPRLGAPRPAAGGRGERRRAASRPAPPKGSGRRGVGRGRPGAPVGAGTVSI